MATNNRAKEGAAANSPSNGQDAPNAAEAIAEDELTQPSEVVVEGHITVRDLARLIGRSPIDLIKILMQYGIMAPITHNIDHDTAVILGEEFGVKVNWPDSETEADEEIEEEEEASSQQAILQGKISAQKESDLFERPPVVAVLGHVDHGKTTLLDRIRDTDVAGAEAGGITQRTGAYQVTTHGGKITFLDTPGHEAFTAMRSRGAQVTDIVVLVVAADDGVMPQTKEAISHAKAAGVIIIVALNKVDKDNANPDRVMEELSQEGLQPEEWGGETIVVPMSALNGEGVDELLDNILVVAELEQFSANPKGACMGTVIEAELDRHRGVTTTILVQNGTLKQGDSIVVGTTSGRIKAMFDHEGNVIKSAGPSTPVIILGLNEVPAAGEIFERAKNDREARRTAADRLADVEQAALEPAPQHMSLEDLFARIEGGELKTLNLIVRADMNGTLEPVVQSLNELGNEEVSIKVLQAAIGDISESDVMLAEASDAIIIGFSVNIDKAAKVRADASGIEIRLYNIIYKMIEDIEDALTGMLEPVYENVAIGHAQILKVFRLRRGNIAGCSISDGVARRNALAHVLRGDAEIIPETRIDTLRRFEEDVPEVRTGFECGIRLANSSVPLQEGDVIEIFERQRVR